MSTKASDYDYHLPEGRIALYPPARRGDSRLMVLDRKTGAITHRVFSELPELLASADALVLNDTRVVPARVIGRLVNGFETEFLIVRFAEEGALCLVRGLKKLKPGARIEFGGGLFGEFVRRMEEMGLVRFNLQGTALNDWLEKNGHIPLPPYIARADESLDKERYQTVFAEKDGSCAAPTAGLHFTPEILAAIAARGIGIHKVCLHVGPGTFRPIQQEDILLYTPDAEYAKVPEGLFEKLADAKKSGGRVVAVGTTTTRALETAALHGGAYKGFTDMFIYPGFKFRAVDALVTNFHLPRSPLLALVCAFAGRERVLVAYEEAIREGYRFYSYGDAMMVV
ncbi:MAG: tRNA preQ1(34) S-adenosylmethionine ribosyltransferase-isomerase QueA [Nitrospinae bacterium]|nr:tRNA preQ1(34) S-adenosylmethionine ribosyltransferase-isomerase QueA [Nitrospinota bacterium]